MLELIGDMCTFLLELIRFIYILYRYPSDPLWKTSSRARCLGRRGLPLGAAAPVALQGPPVHEIHSPVAHHQPAHLHARDRSTLLVRKYHISIV